MIMTTLLAAAVLSAANGPDAAAPDGSTALMRAAGAGDLAAVKALLKDGANVNARDAARGQTALMFAAAKNRTAVVAFLSKNGADLAATSNVVKLERPRVDEDGNPLPAAPPAGAAGGGRGGGRPQQGLGGTARGASATVMGGLTALLYAAREGHMESALALLEAGANINQQSAGEKDTPLIIAICNGHYDLAKKLLDLGADPNLKTIDGLAALYAVEDTEYAQVGWAPNPITTQEKTSHLDLLKAVLAKGGDPNAKLAKTLWFRPTHHNQEWIDKKGATPFWRAAQAADVEAMKILKAGGADPKVATEEGVTPLMAAAGLGWGANASRTVPGGWIDAVTYCLELGADVNARDNYGYTALHGAAYRGDNELVKLLAAKGARMDFRSKRGQSVTDMANGPVVNAHLPRTHPGTIALLMQLGAPKPGIEKQATSISTNQEVEFEMMTWPEIKKALAEGRTTILVFNGGTEQRGPQGIAGAHNLVAKALGREIAKKLGNALLAPVLPYSVNRAVVELPGTIGLTGPQFAAINEQVAEQFIVNGFRNIVLMGDHGGGQRELAEVAKKLTEKHGAEGIRVHYCADVYAKAGAEFNKWLEANGYPVGAHASIKDTSEMLHLGGDKWIRKEEIPNAFSEPGKRSTNGVSGDARRASPEIGKVISEMKVQFAVEQIRQLVGESKAAGK